MSKYNKLGLYTDRFPEGTGTPTQQGDYDIYGNKINELTSAFEFQECLISTGCPFSLTRP